MNSGNRGAAATLIRISLTSLIGEERKKHSVFQLPELTEYRHQRVGNGLKLTFKPSVDIQRYGGWNIGAWSFERLSDP